MNIKEQYSNSSNLNARQRLHDLFSTNRYGWHLWVFDQLDLSACNHILELGCGAGTLWRTNRHRISGDLNLALSDLSAGMLNDAKAKLNNAGLNATFLEIDAQSISYESDTFDAVIANHVLYHVPDISRALSEIRRVLKPSGYFYAATNGQNHLRELRELVKTFDPDINFENWRNPFTLENGLDQLSRFFTDIDVRRHHDSLAITRTKPLVDYVLSTMSTALDILVGRKLIEFENLIEGKLSQDGIIEIGKDSGMFVARKPVVV